MKTKRLTKFGAVLSAALVLLSGILSVSAASVPQAVIDTDRKASVSLYKYDFTSAHADGVLGDNTYISTGYADENVENTLMPYAIEGVVFSYAKIADLAVHAETKDGEHQNMLLYKLPGGDKTTALINCLDLTSEDAYKTDRGDLYFTSDTLIDALSDHLNTAESQQKTHWKLLSAKTALLCRKRTAQDTPRLQNSNRDYICLWKRRFPKQFPTPPRRSCFHCP